MALLISPHNQKYFPHLLREMFTLRHKIFVGHMKWEGVRSPDGIQEIDEFDTDKCHYLLGLSPDGRVMNSMRITAARDPNVSCDVLAPQMGWKVDRSGNRMEMSRLCADPVFDGPDAKLALLDLKVSISAARQKLGFHGGIGVMFQSELVRRIRSGQAMEIQTGPFTFPGDKEPSFGFLTQSDPNGTLESMWKALDPAKHGLMDPDETPELIEQFRERTAA